MAFKSFGPKNVIILHFLNQIWHHRLEVPVMGGGGKCYICQDPGHLANRCPQRNNNGNMSSDLTVKSGNRSPRPLEE